MSLKNKKLVAILGGRKYLNNLTLRNFLTPEIRNKLKENNIDFIVATNNKSAAKEYKQIENIKVIETSKKLHNSFKNRQRESFTNLGAETRETINQYSIKNKYAYTVHLDDNITDIYVSLYNPTLKKKYAKKTLIKKYKPQSFYEIIKLLFFVIEKSNSGCVGITMSQYPSSNNPRITAGFPYSFFVHKIDKNFEFENSTEDDIIMSIYNGKKGKPSCVIRDCVLYSKTGKSKSKDGNRIIYNKMLKKNERGQYAEKTYPEIYTRKISYMEKSSTSQKKISLQHKHRLRKPLIWDEQLKVDKIVFQEIKNVVTKIYKREKNV